MRLRSVFLSTLAVVAANVLWPTAARADIAYDNSSGVGTNAYPSTLEYGDEVILGTTGTTMTAFQFEYYADFTPTGAEGARLRIYKNDGPIIQSSAGPVASPGTVLFDSGPFPISPGYQTKTFAGISIVIPRDVIWTVQFTGLVGVAGDSAGLIVRPAPTVGFSFDDFWINNAGNWQLFTLSSGLPANFAARIASVAQPPNLFIKRSSSFVLIEWNGAYVLQGAEKLDGPFTDVSDAHSLFWFDPRSAHYHFWRLRPAQ